MIAVVLDFVNSNQVILGLLLGACLFAPWDERRRHFALWAVLGAVALLALSELLYMTGQPSVLNLTAFIVLVFLWVLLCFDCSLVRRQCRNFQAQAGAAASSLQIEGAVFGSEPRQGRGRRPGGSSVGGWVPLWAGGCAAEPLPAADTGEAEQGQRSAFCKRAPPRAAKTGHRNPDGFKMFPPAERQSFWQPIRREGERQYRSLPRR